MEVSKTHYIVHCTCSRELKVNAVTMNLTLYMYAYY